MSLESQTQISEQEVIERFDSIVTMWSLDEKYHPAARMAIDHYVQNKLYHNLNHMFEVSEKVLELFDEHEHEFGLTQQNRQELLVAALWHDADYHLPLSDPGESKEHRSARLAFNAIIDTAETNDPWEVSAFAGGVAFLILSTEPSHKVEYGTPAYLLNLADLDNLTGTRQDTLMKSGKFFIEQLIAKGKQNTESAQEAIDAHSDSIRLWCLGTRYHLSELVEVKQLPGSISKRIAQITPSAVKDVLAKLALLEAPRD